MPWPQLLQLLQAVFACEVASWKVLAGQLPHTRSVEAVGAALCSWPLVQVDQPVQAVPVKPLLG